jgi:hypothetical protein
MKILKCFRPDGDVRAVWDDSTARGFRAAGVVPRRASRIEVIGEGPAYGLFHVDFSPLADLTGDERYRVCLTRAFESYAEANRAEVEWLTGNWVLGDPDG